MSIDEKLAEYRARKAKEFLACYSVLLNTFECMKEAKDKQKSVETVATQTMVRPLSTPSNVATKAFHYAASHIAIAFTFLLNGLLHLKNTRLASLLSGYLTNSLEALRETRLSRLVYDYAIKLQQEYQRRCTLFSLSQAVKLAVWAAGWAVFIYVEFGAVYFIVSLLFFIYFSTRSGGEKDLGPSAYSVFNAGCERLDGTFTAEQFEKELRYGPSSVH